MADNIPETSVQSELISAGLNPNNPSMTTVDFANSMASARQNQAAQEQAIARAKELTSQARLQTRQGLQAEAAGVNPLLADVMTPEQAVAYLRLILKEKGLEITEDDIDNWVKTLTGPINRNIVETFANRFARETTRSNPAFQATADDAKSAKRDENGEPLVEGQMYTALYNNQGKIASYIRGGKEPTDTSAKDDKKAASETAKQWQKLDTTINTAFKTRSGGLGSLSTAIFRAVRAINTLNSTPNLTSQDLANVAQDVAGIFQGGAPTAVTAQDNDYHLALLNMADWFRSQTGVMANIGHLFGKANSPLEPTKRKLLQVCVDLRDSAINNLKTFTEAEEPAYREIIEADPKRWEEMQTAKLKFIESGLLIPSEAKTQLNITGAGNSAAPKDPHSKAEGSTKVVPKYTVEE